MAPWAPWHPGTSEHSGACTNTFSVPISVADQAVLDVVELEALGGRMINELTDPTVVSKEFTEWAEPAARCS